MHTYVLELSKHSYKVYCIDCGFKKLVYLYKSNGSLMDPFVEYEHILKLHKPL